MSNLKGIFRVCGHKKHYKTLDAAEQAKRAKTKSNSELIFVNKCQCGFYYMDNKLSSVFSCKNQTKKRNKTTRRKLKRHCEGKHHYDTEEKAIKAKFYLSKRYKKPLKVYKCSVCGLFALSSIRDSSGQFRLKKVK